MMSTRKIQRMLQAEYPDAEIGVTNSGHIRLRFPDGVVAYASTTPSDLNFFKQLRRDIRRRRVTTKGRR